MSKKKITKKNDTTFYPIFQECSEFTLDSFWKDIFIKCSKNKFPSNMTFDAKNSLVLVKKDKKIMHYPLAGLKSTDIFVKMLSIFKELGIHSTKEIQNYIDSVKDKNINSTTTEWKKIRPKRAREILLLEFIKRVSKERKLTQRKTRELTSVIFVSSQLGEITSSDIVLRKGEIKNIRNLKISSNNIKIEKKKTNTKQKKSEDTLTLLCDDVVDKTLSDSEDLSASSSFYSYYDKFLKTTFKET
jgi:hypothetical protein